MLNYDFLKAAEDYIHAFRGLVLPVVLCDTKFQVYWSNPIAKVNYESLTTTEFLHEFLGEYDLDQLAATILEQGSKVIGGIVPLNTLRLNLSPIIHNGSYIGIILMITQPSDSPSLQKLKETSLAASIFSSEVRSTLSGIFSSMDSIALKSELLNAEWIKADLNSVAVDSYQILRLSDNITKFAQFRNQDADLQLVSYNIFSWFKKIKDSIVALGETMNTPVTFDISGEDEYIRVDAQKFEIAFFNVLHNAFYFTRAGNHLQITAYPEETYVKITVQDHGIGIQKDILPLVYTPFFSYLPSGFKPNLGLGLTVAHMIFAAHGGTISIESLLGEGTLVTITLPYPNPSDTIHFAQENDIFSLQDRFSPMYVGVISAKSSPFMDYEL